MRQLKIVKSITNRDDFSFQKYLKEISEYDRISPKEEVELAKRIKMGDSNAKDTLVHANLRFVVSVAKQYQHQGLSLGDLTNEGNLGLIKAAGLFDETRGFKFISFAVWWIRQAILQALATSGRMIRLPQNKISLKGKTNKAITQLTHNLEREPTAEEIAEYANLPVDEIVKALDMRDWNCVSIDGSNHEDSEYSLLDFLPDTLFKSPDDSLRSEDLSITLMEVLNTIPPRFKEALIHRFGLFGEQKKSFEEIGAKFFVAPMYAQQLVAKGLQKLKSQLVIRERLKVFL